MYQPQIHSLDRAVMLVIMMVMMMVGSDFKNHLHQNTAWFCLSFLLSFGGC